MEREEQEGHPAIGLVPAELVAVHEAEGIAACWMDIASNMRVKFAVPMESLSHLELSPGDDFLWDVDNKRALRSFRAALDSPVREQMGKSLDELNKRFHEDLKHRKTGLENES